MPIIKENIYSIGAGVAALALLPPVISFPLIGTILCARIADYRMDKKSIKPRSTISDEQLGVVDFLASRFDTLCLGDTKHDSRSSFDFITDENFQKRLAGKGARNLFVELGYPFQPIISDFESGKISRDQFTAIMNRHMVTASSTAKDKLRIELLATSIAEKNLAYHAVDSRELQGTKNIALAARLLNTLTRIFFPRFFPHKIGFLFAFTAMACLHRKKIREAILDDTKAAANITACVAPQELCAIAYGAGHFSGIAENFGMQDMRGLMQKNGRNPVVVNIYESDRQRAEYTENKDPLFHMIMGKVSIRKADVEFVLGTAGSPGKVIFNNPVLEAAYKAQIGQPHPATKPAAPAA